MEKRYKYVVPYLICDLKCGIIHPLRDAAFDTDCLTPFRILKIIKFDLKMNSGNAIKNCYMLFRFYSAVLFR